MNNKFFMFLILLLSGMNITAYAQPSKINFYIQQNVPFEHDVDVALLSYITSETDHIDNKCSIKETTFKSNKQGRANFLHQLISPYMQNKSTSYEISLCQSQPIKQALTKGIAIPLNNTGDFLYVSCAGISKTKIDLSCIDSPVNLYFILEENGSWRVHCSEIKDSEAINWNNVSCQKLKKIFISMVSSRKSRDLNSFHTIIESMPANYVKKMNACDECKYTLFDFAIREGACSKKSNSCTNAEFKKILLALLQAGIKAKIYNRATLETTDGFWEGGISFKYLKLDNPTEMNTLIDLLELILNSTEDWGTKKAIRIGYFLSYSKRLKKVLLRFVESVQAAA